MIVLTRVHIASLADATTIAASVHPRRALAILDPQMKAPKLKLYGVRRQATVRFLAAEDASGGDEGPSVGELEKLLGFLLDGEPGDMLIFSPHGKRRAPAAAYIAIALSARRGREQDAAAYIRRCAPHAEPDREMVAIADQLVGRSGGLISGLGALPPAGAEGYRGPCSVEMAI